MYYSSSHITVLGLLCICVLYQGVISESPTFKQHHACFSTVFEISCQETEIIVFEAAQYGRNDTRIAQACGTPYQRGCDIDVHFTLNRKCAGKQKCSLAVNTALFGDPCGYEEFLNVKYICVQVSDITQSCRGDANGPPLYDNGYVTSPNYPGKYYRSAECKWFLVVQKRQTILITYYDFELNIKLNGECTDFLEISSGNRVYFKDCGALGRQSIMIDSNTAAVRFKTSPNSVTQRGFHIRFQAIGPGCPDIEKLPHGSVLYYVHNDVLYANATCERGYVILGTMREHLQLKCMGKYWSKSITECIAVPNTTPIGLRPQTHPYETTTEDSPGAAIDVFISSTTGIALGAVSALLLLTLLLVVIIYLRKRRRHRKAEKEHWRVVVNNFQENELNSYDEDQNWKNHGSLDGRAPTCNIKKAAGKPHGGKSNKKQNNNYCDEGQGRNLLVSQYGGVYDDADDTYIMDYTDLHRDFQDQCNSSTPVKGGGYNQPIYTSSRPPSRRNSRSSKYGFNRQGSRENQLDESSRCGAGEPQSVYIGQGVPPRNQSFCVACNTAAPGRQTRSYRDLRHKRTKSGHWESNKTQTYTPSPPEVPIYGFPKALTQSAPDLLELCAPPVMWTLPPDQTYAPVPPPKPCPQPPVPPCLPNENYPVVPPMPPVFSESSSTSSPSYKLNHKSSKSAKSKKGAKQAQQLYQTYQAPTDRTIGDVRC